MAWQTMGMETYFKQYVVNVNTTAYFKLNGNGADLSANNWSYYTPTGNTSGGLQSWDTNGFLNQALKSTGTTLCYIIPYLQKMIIPAGAKTISFWFKQNGIGSGDYRYIMGNTYPYDGGISSGTTIMQMADGSMQVQINGGASRQIYLGISGTYKDNKFHHYCLTWNGTTTTNGVKFLVDGLVSVQTTSSWQDEPNNATYTFCFGASSGGIYNFEGWLDEVIIENRAWSVDEVSSYYNNYFPHGTP